MTIQIIIAEDARKRLQKIFRRPLETASLKMGTKQSSFPRPFLRSAIHELRPAIEKKLKSAIDAAIAEQLKE